MSRPGGVGENLRKCYSENKWFHCLIYQTITTTDDLMFYLYGPEVDRRQDMTLYLQSGMNESFQEGLAIGGNQYCLYGDSAYLVRRWLQNAFSRVGATLEQTTYNERMSAVREEVEWKYKDIKQCFASEDFKNQLKVRQTPVALLYKLP